jgi:hypothetical protein
MGHFEPIRKEMKIVTGKDPHDAWKVSLPKDACRYLNWKPGDTVVFSVTKNGMAISKKV